MKDMSWVVWRASRIDPVLTFAGGVIRLCDSRKETSQGIEFAVQTAD